MLINKGDMQEMLILNSTVICEGLRSNKVWSSLYAYGYVQLETGSLSQTLITLNLNMDN